MNLSAITEKLRNKTEKIKDHNARTSALREEKEHDAQARFNDAIQEGVSSLRRFVDSDEYKEVIEFLQAMEEIKKENGKSIFEISVEALEAKKAKYQKARRRLVDLDTDEARAKLRAFNDKYFFPLEGEIKKMCELDMDIRIYFEGDGCILTHEGFKRSSNSAVRGKLSLEDIVEKFSKIDDPERHPSKLIPFIKAELKKRADLV